MPFRALRHVTIHYYERGDAATASEHLVMTHGLRRSARGWQLVQRALPRRYHSIAVDNRGAGRTTAPPDPEDYGVQVFADDLYELVTALGLRDLTLVGASDGGGTAMQFAVDHPELLKALVLVDPTDPDGHLPEGMTLDAFVDKRVRSWRRLRDRILAGDTSMVAPSAPEAFRTALLRDITNAPEQRIRGAVRSMASLRIGDRVREIGCPVLLLSGDEVPLAKTVRTLEKLPSGTYVEVVHAAGHAVNIDRPREVAAVLRRFLDETVPAHASRPAPGA